LKNLISTCLRPGAFRLFLAGVVVLSHTMRYDLGAWAVCTFYILSGYWIYRMWTQKYARARNPLATFYASRAWRILPLFWLANAIGCTFRLATEPAFFGPNGPHWPTVPAILSNLFVFGYADMPATQRALDVAWSLDLEFQFYLFFPLLLLLCGKSRLGMAWSVVFVAGFALGLVTMLIPVTIEVRTLANYGLFFLLGAAAAKHEWRPSPSLAAGIIAAVAAFCALCLVVPAWYHLVVDTQFGPQLENNHHRQIFQAALALLTAPVALCSVRNSSSPSDRHLGEFTFALYLFHWPVVVFYRHYYGQLRGMARLPSLSVAWLAIAGLSLGAYWLFDRPIERWRRRWVAGRIST
jgi:peptidoglycan/LPS O-acetylase OafA/YrhL